MTKVVLNWGKYCGLDEETASPRKGLTIRLVEGRYYSGDVVKYDTFKVHFKLGSHHQQYKHIRLSNQSMSLRSARSDVRKWLENNHVAVYAAQDTFETQILHKRGAGLIAMLNQKIDLQAKLDEELRRHDRNMANYNQQYDMARRGLRTRSVPSGQFKNYTKHVRTGSRMEGGFFGDGAQRVDVYIDETERVELHKDVPDYPDKPAMSDKVYEIRREIAALDLEIKKYSKE